jgi:CBS domain-containing protein
MDRARDAMNKNVLTISEDASVEEAIRALLEHHISGMPVVDYRGNLVGIITEFQLLEALHTPEVKKYRVRELMTRDVTTVSENTALADVAGMLVMQRIRRIPVVRDGEVVGVIARRDLLRYIVQSEGSLEGFFDKMQGCVPA